MFTQKLVDTIVVTEEGVHQAILDVAYDKWQSEKEWGMGEMLAYAENDLGRIARFAVQVGKYNQQVTNGGHAQYYDNGYASDGGGCFGSHEGFEFHEQMIADMETFDIEDKIIHGAEVLRIMKELLDVGPGTCDGCDGQGGYETEGEEDDDGEWTDGEWEDCYTCNGDGEDEDMLGYTDHLDTQYYKVYEAFMIDVEAFFADQLAKAQDQKQAA